MARAGDAIARANLSGRRERVEVHWSRDGVEWYLNSGNADTIVVGAYGKEDSVSTDRGTACILGLQPDQIHLPLALRNSR